MPVIHFRHCERSAAIHGCAFPTMDRHGLRPLSMNRLYSYGLRHWNHLLSKLPGQALQGTLFGLQHLCLVVGQAMLDVIDSLDHDAPELGGQFACQGDVGHECAPSRRHPSVEPAQGNVLAARQGSGHDAEHSANAIALAFCRAFALAALSATRGKTGPSREVLLRGPLAQICPHLADEAQDAILGMRRQHREILAIAQACHQLAQPVNFRRVLACAFAGDCG